MGHTPSKSPKLHSESILISTGSPSSLGFDDTTILHSINRRASGLPIIRTSNLDTSRLSDPHRRVRSAHVPSSRSMVDLNPPPPYSPTAENRPVPPPRPRSHTPPPSHPPTRSNLTPNSLAPPHTGTPATGSNPTASSSTNRYAQLRAPMRQRSVENALETLRKYRTVFIVDDSRSMYGSLWTEASNALATLAEHAQKYNTDGIDVHFFNSIISGTGLRSRMTVKHLFQRIIPKGATPMGEKLEELLLLYLSSLEHAKELADAGDSKELKAIKPINFIVITDGSPTDDPESVIVAIARRLDAKHYPINQVGIQFVQIGDSPEATEFLTELDDGLASNYGIRDMVDTTPYTGGELNAEVLTKILLGGINRRVDRRGGASVIS